MKSLLWLLLFVPSVLAAQSVSVRSVTAPVDMLTVNDVDFLKSTTPKWLFTIEVTVAPPGTSLDLVMRIHLDVALATGETFPDAVSLETSPFTVTGTRTITNLDLQQPGFVASSETDPVARERLEQTALPSGVVPAGVYLFQVEVVPVSGGAGARDEFRFTLRNPSTVELLAPMDGETVATTFPLFQWVFDGSSATISLYEKLEGQATYEEAASGVPLLTEEVMTPYFQYPTAGARALQPGGTYVWFVEGRVRRSGGSDLLVKSELHAFTVSREAGLAVGGPTISLLDELERALGPQYAPLFDQLREGGFTATGDIRVDGSAISPLDMLEILNRFRTQPESVLSVRVE
jgi:sulfur carrier protein ThiS